MSIGIGFSLHTYDSSQGYLLAFVRIRKSVVYLLLNEKAERNYGLAYKNVSERYSHMQGINLSCESDGIVVCSGTG